MNFFVVIAVLSLLAKAAICLRSGSVNVLVCASEGKAKRFVGRIFECQSE